MVLLHNSQIFSEKKHICYTEYTAVKIHSGSLGILTKRAKSIHPGNVIFTNEILLNIQHLFTLMTRVSHSDLVSIS